MSRCRHITSKLTAVLQMERKLGVLSNSSVSGAESGTEKMRSRQQHSLFTRANTAASNAANSGANFDVEAVKLHHGRWGQIFGISQPIVDSVQSSVCRTVWLHHEHREQSKRPSISSEESVSDYEQVSHIGENIY